ncbi:unnamed protein product, partial [marine sediment metagenome]
MHTINSKSPKEYFSLLESFKKINKKRPGIGTSLETSQRSSVLVYEYSGGIYGTNHLVILGTDSRDIVAYCAQYSP